VRFYGM